MCACSMPCAQCQKFLRFHYGDGSFFGYLSQKNRNLDCATLTMKKRHQKKHAQT